MLHLFEILSFLQNRTNRQDLNFYSSLRFNAGGPDGLFSIENKMDVDVFREDAKFGKRSIVCPLRSARNLSVMKWFIAFCDIFIESGFYHCFR